MFWKNAKDYVSSIRIRLAFLYSLSAFVFILLIAAFLYWESLNVLHKANYQFLSNEIETISSLLRQNKPDVAALKKLVIDIPSDTDNSIYRYFVRLVNVKNEISVETPGIEKILPKKKSIGSFTLFKKTYYANFSRNNCDYMLVQAPVVINHQIAGKIQIVLDITHQNRIVENRQFIMNSLLLITLCAFLLGTYLSRKGIQSLYTLTETTSKITIASLSKRIDPKYWPNELRQLGISFNQMLSRMESSILQLKQFSADLAHELRTPVNNLIGQTEIALSYSQDPIDYQQVLSSNLEELHRISQLIENILFLARAENPEIQIEKININVRDEIHVICEYYEAILQEKCLQVTCDGNAVIFANMVMFRRVISNLLSNAIKYTEHDGNIRFIISETEKVVEIKISDTGIGIAAPHLEKVFERFYRIDHARSQQSGGIGLGLPIVKSIMELHQGTIAIKSELQEGTTFSLVFPK